jgi:hypothetical protein
MSAGPFRRFIHFCGQVMTEITDDDLVHYELRLDRKTFRHLQTISEQHGCGIGGVIRFYVKNAIASAKARSRKNSQGYSCN